MSTTTSFAVVSAMASSTPALTTTFVPQVTGCVQNHLTMLELKSNEIWMNEPVPVPNTTISDCYPTQYMTSFLNLAGGVTQPAFDPLVCPQSYTQVAVYTSNYIACCPTGYLLHPADSPPSDRPAFGGTCYTPLPSGTAYRVTSYGTSSLEATSTFQPTDTLAQAYAYPYEGTAYGVAEQVIITTGGTTSTINTVLSGTATSTGSSASATTTGAATTYTISAASDPVFTPNTVSAKVGDTLLFSFTAGNHSVTQSTFDHPCVALSGGQDSGLMANLNSTTSPAPSFSFLVQSTSSEWFYSKGAGDCAAGMVFALNPSSSQTEALFLAAAISSASTAKKSGLSTGAKIAIGVVIPVVLLALLAGLFVFFRRRNKGSKGSEATEIEQQNINPAAEGYYAGRDYKTPNTEMGDYHDVSSQSVPTTSEMHGDHATGELPAYVTDPVEMPHRRYSHNEHFSELESPVSTPNEGTIKR